MLWNPNSHWWQIHPKNQCNFNLQTAINRRKNNFSNFKIFNKSSLWSVAESWWWDTRPLFLFALCVLINPINIHLHNIVNILKATHLFSFLFCTVTIILHASKHYQHSMTLHRKSAACFQIPLSKECTIYYEFFITAWNDKKNA